MHQSNLYLIIHQGEAQLWYWRVQNAQGEIIEQAPFGFSDRNRCIAHAHQRGYKDVQELR
jgi:hypothetical protein